MTSLNGNLEVLKQDSRGRVRVAASRREALLDEFDRSGLSGAKFARLAGVKYSTFAAWVARRRKQHKVLAVCPSADQSGRDAGGEPVRLFEAVVDEAALSARDAAGAGGLVIELPGGARTRVESALHLRMAAELVVLIAQAEGGRC
jgi:hypothetical protein